MVIARRLMVLIERRQIAATISMQLKEVVMATWAK